MVRYLGLDFDHHAEFLHGSPHWADCSPRWLEGYEGVTGFDNNPGSGHLDQPSNVFLIKGTKKPSVVPIIRIGEQ